MNVDISVKWFGDNFNINFAKEGEDFFSLKGCSIKEHQGSEFISVPAKKNEKTGKWWRHAWLADGFSTYVLDMAKKSQPRQPGSDDDLGDQQIPF